IEILEPVLDGIFIGEQLHARPIKIAERLYPEFVAIGRIALLHMDASDARANHGDVQYLLHKGPPAIPPWPSAPYRHICKRRYSPPTPSLSCQCLLALAHGIGFRLRR